MDSVPYARVEAPRAPLYQRISLRMIVFGGLVLMLVGFPMYWYLDSAISGGVKDIGGGYKLVDLKAMSTFSFDQQRGTLEDIPRQWRELDGQKVVMYGEMWNALSAGNGQLGSFELCYSIAKCCFQGPPQVQHFVFSRPAPGRELYYYPNLVKVTGVLHVNVVRDPGANKISQIYQMDVENIEPAG